MCWQKIMFWEVVYFSDCEKSLLNSEGDECLQNLYKIDVECLVKDLNRVKY